MLLHIVIIEVCLLYFNSASEYLNTNANNAVVNSKMNIEDSPSIENSRRYRKPDLRIRNDYSVNFEDKSLRIRGGNITDISNFPYMAAIIINGRLWCAGAIVDENWVVTAAHCLNYVLHVSPMKSLGKYVKIRVGSVRPHEGGILVDVVGAVRHPKFEEEPVPHADVALLKLAENLEFSTHVNLIKIYDGLKEPYAQSFVVVSGWGATSGSDTAFRDHTPDLLSTRLKVRTRHYCIDAYQLVNGFQFTEDFFCASLRNGIRDACLFDAGAPAVQQNRLMGIMSFGPERCGHEFQPTVFIKAFYFRDFVKSTIASYKKTADLIEAMKQMEPALNPRGPMNVAGIEEETPKDVHLGFSDDVTVPDHRHD
ncbi:trypsin 3A1-like [Galleria mellonella]|uniref:Trypsin 3A1-like n=1 Tax=Galleria mellonella TaxID=7137 RepID=A0A6J1WI19_GALME|nr:trypsin 3A1-like [Galleria mellonella]